MNDRLGELLAELAKQYSPATEEELARARSEWPDLPASAITHRRRLRRPAGDRLASYSTADVLWSASRPRTC
jgi:hypothetical protein